MEGGGREVGGGWRRREEGGRRVERVLIKYTTTQYKKLKDLNDSLYGLGKYYSNKILQHLQLLQIIKCTVHVERSV